MAYIGRIAVNLNTFGLVLALALALTMAPSAGALDRQLSPQEVAVLEANLKKDPKSGASRRFLFDHYFNDKQWAKAAATGQPAQEDLTQDQLLNLTEAFKNLEDGAGLLSVIPYYHGKFQPTSHTRYLEGLGHFFSAKKATLLAKKRELATLAIGFFKDSIRLDPKPTESYFAWLTTLKEFWKEYYDDAIQVYRLLDIATKDKKTYLAEKCELYLDNHLWNEAIETCSASVEVFPGKVESYARLAAALQVRGDLEKAKAVLAKAIKRNPESFNVQKGTADLYFLENNFVLAADHYKNALQIDPTATPLYLNLALSEYPQKKYPEALSAFHKNCYMAKKIPKEFVNAVGQLRANIEMYNKYKLIMSSCTEIKPK